MAETKNEPATPGPWKIERGYIRGPQGQIVAAPWKWEHPDTQMILAAPETKRQRDAALVVLRRLLAFPGNMVVETEARALLAECENGSAD
jgi:hypothetical protein